MKSYTENYNIECHVKCHCKEQFNLRTRVELMYILNDFPQH
jgi:hypothetical protein